MGAINVSTLGREELKTTVLVFGSDKLSLFPTVLYMMLSLGRRKESNDLTDSHLLSASNLSRVRRAAPQAIGRLTGKYIVFSHLSVLH